LHKGIEFTTAYLDMLGVTHCGVNPQPTYHSNPLIREIKGIKIALLSHTFSTNGIALQQGKEYGVDVTRFNALRDRDYDDSALREQISTARSMGAHCIIASLHWGLEFEYYPPRRLVERGHRLLEAGVDVILGHHPHILNPIEWYVTADNRRTLCCYSLGSFTTYALKGNTKNMAEIVGFGLRMQEDGNRAAVVNPQIMPTWFRKPSRRAPGMIFSIYEEMAALRSDKGAPRLCGRDAQRIERLYNEYNRYFLQPRAFEYR
jgi:poly-gamma-glutamate synthesis protein (capsule biosynthesis protein)